MKVIKIIKFLVKSKHPHFLSVEKKTYNRWKFVIQLIVSVNRNYKSCEIYRKKFKSLEDFVVVGLKYSGKNVKRRTSGFAKNFVTKNKGSICLYCEGELSHENATADHIVPISEGGNNSQVNLIVCCKDCNAERGNTEFKSYLYSKNKKYVKNKGNIVI